ncbi:hypothetical protein HPB48_015751 [Haemaphysalis longicornis]|uniref:Uncharacterized protein n=1 Tax=Haemaphysalis longicornis TaxID=44386 RepID=A0A9J6H640_HAELO|nr:hypothetical protein HPB48_015751 [Haemaphysalis longicornis]
MKSEAALLYIKNCGRPKLRTGATTGRSVPLGRRLALRDRATPISRRRSPRRGLRRKQASVRPSFVLPFFFAGRTSVVGAADAAHGVWLLSRFRPRNRRSSVTTAAACGEECPGSECDCVESRPSRAARAASIPAVECAALGVSGFCSIRIASKKKLPGTCHRITDVYCQEIVMTGRWKPHEQDIDWAAAAKANVPGPPRKPSAHMDPRPFSEHGGGGAVVVRDELLPHGNDHDDELATTAAGGDYSDDLARGVGSSGSGDGSGGLEDGLTVTMVAVIVAVTAPLAIALLLLVVLVAYRRRYPVRMVFGRKFPTFENPAYVRKDAQDPRELARLSAADRDRF